MFYKGHRFLTEDVNLIRPYFKDFWGTDFSTLTAAIALIRINGSVPVPGPILTSVIGDHVISFYSFDFRIKSATCNPKSAIGY